VRNTRAEKSGGWITRSLLQRRTRLSVYPSSFSVPQLLIGNVNRRKLFGVRRSVLWLRRN